MKLTGLDKALVTFGGEPIQQTPDETLKVKDVLMTCLSRMKSEKGAESMHIFKLGTEIFAANTDCPIESKDMALLKHAVEQNAPEFIALVQGQALAYLEDIDTADKKAGKAD
jgi:hypothetical protein